MQTIKALWLREIIRFYRQPSRVVGAIGSPLLFWLLIGSGIGSSFQSQADLSINNYSTFFFPGTLMLILLFTSIFSTISIIEDRKEGFLQGVLVSPASRSSIVFGKVLGGMTLAIIQCFLFMLLSPFAGITFTLQSFFLILGVLVINAFTLTSLGFLIAWQFESIQGFHAVMNLLLMPLWILSGALFPKEGASVWIQWIMKLNPLSYGMDALHLVFFQDISGSMIQNLSKTLSIALISGLLLFIAATLLASKRSVKGAA